MNTHRDNNPEEFLDLLVDDIRNEPVDAATVEESSNRVWDRIAKQAPRPTRLSTCEDFQALIPAYREGTLAPGRRMLLEDHSHSCVACRKVVFGEVVLAGPPPANVVEMPARRMTRSKWMSIAAAGAIALAFGRYGYEQFAPAPDGIRGTVEVAQGNVYRLQNAQLLPVSAGTELDQSEVLRTAAGSNAVVKLMDGSVMEVGERAEFRLTASRRDVTVHLQRGAVIVQAAKRRQGHLYVATGDSRVAVTGTVFSVNRGAKGTRVSVAEGEVVVEHRDRDRVLHSGDQLATDRSMVAVPVDQEFAWSRNASEHVKLLQNMADMKKALENVRMPGIRYASPLLDHVPANAVLVLSVPNMRESFEDAQRLVKEQLSRAGAQQNEQALEFIERMAKVTEYLGEEIVVALVPSGRESTVVAVADVHRPNLKEFLEKEWTGTNSGHALRVIEGDGAVQMPAGQDLAVVIRGNRIAFSPDTSLVEAALSGNTGFSATPFGQRVSQAVREGTGILLAVDLQTVIKRETKKDSDQAILSRAGADGVRYLIAEQETFNGNTQHSAVLNFDGPRHGMASWLAAPGPMGGLSFVSPRAQFAASVITKNPQQMIDEFFAFLEAQGPEGRQAFERIQNQAGVDIRRDIAASLGSEATFAIDGPIIPVPSWKAIIEVNQPERLQQAIAKMVAAANTEIQRTEKGAVGIKLETENSPQGMVFYKLSAGEGNGQITTAYYTYNSGYLIAGPLKELIATAIQNRDNGVRLDTSHEFRHLLPRDQNANFSALVYQNAKESLKLLSSAVPDNQESARALMDKLEPTLIGAYASEDRIQVTTYGSSMDLLMQTAFAPMLHGNHNRAAVKKRGTTTTAAAYR